MKKIKEIQIFPPGAPSFIVHGEEIQIDIDSDGFLLKDENVWIGRFPDAFGYLIVKREEDGTTD